MRERHVNVFASFGSVVRVSVTQGLKVIMPTKTERRMEMSFAVIEKLQIGTAKQQSLSRAHVVQSSRGKVMGHIPDRLAQILSPMLGDGLIQMIIGTITGPARSAPEGVWRIGGGIEPIRALQT